jgi:hypothetical protein
VKIHLKKNPDENKKTLKMRIDAALDYYMQPLCLTCAKNNGGDFEEKLLFDMNRSDQANEKDFKCGAYEK